MRAMLRTRTVLLMVGGLAAGLVFAPGSAIGAQITQVFVSNDTAHPVPVAGAVSVSNLPGTQAVSGTVNVGNLPATQPVSGTVAVSNPAPVTTLLTFADIAPFSNHQVATAAFRTVRVYLSGGASECASASKVVIANDANEVLDTLLTGPGQPTDITRVYEVPGVSLLFTNFAADCHVIVTVYGRTG